MRKLVPLLVLFAVLAALTAYRESLRPSAGSLADEVALRRLGNAPFSAADVHAIEVVAPGESSPTFTLSRDGERWLVDRPFRAPAAAGLVTALTEALASAEGELRSDQPRTLDDFHLTADLGVTITVRGADGESLAQLVLGRSSGRQGAFVRIVGGQEDDDKKAYAVTTNLRGALGLRRTPVGDAAPQAPTGTFFHDKAFPPFQHHGAKSAEIVTPERSVVLGKVRSSWEPTKGAPGLKFKPNALDRPLQYFGGALKPRGLVDPARRAEVGLDTPAYRLALTMGDGTVRAVNGSVHMGEDGAREFYLRLDVEQNPDVIYQVNRQAFSGLFPQGSALVDFPALDVQDQGLGKIVVEVGGERIVMIRENGRPQNPWKLLEPTLPLEPSKTSLAALGAVLRSVSAVDWVDSPTTIDAPEIVVRWGDEKTPDDQLMQILVGGTAPGGVDRLAMLPTLPGRVLVLSDPTVKRLAPEPLSLYHREILREWKVDEVLAVRVARVSGGQPEPYFVALRQDDQWKVGLEPALVTALPQKVEEWIKRLVGARVSEVSSEPISPAYEVTLERSNGDPVTVPLGEVADGKRAVTIGGVTFLVDEDDLMPDHTKFEARHPDEDDDEDADKDDEKDE